MGGKEFPEKPDAKHGWATKKNDIKMFKGLRCSKTHGIVGSKAKKIIDVALKLPKVGPTAPTDMMKVEVNVCGMAALPMLYCNSVTMKADPTIQSSSGWSGWLLGFERLEDGWKRLLCAGVVGLTKQLGNVQ